MSHKQKEQLTVDGEWRKHLKPEGKRQYWKGERKAGKIVSVEQPDSSSEFDSEGCQFESGRKRQPKR